MAKWRASPRPRCRINGCRRKVKARGYCGNHYYRHMRYGDPLFELKSIGRRFWSKVEVDGPLPLFCPELGKCWVWTSCRQKGYATFAVDGQTRRAYRVAYELVVGPIPKGLHLDHLCDNGRAGCVNPMHLEPVTNAENARRAAVRREAMREALYAVIQDPSVRAVATTAIRRTTG